MTNDIDIAGTRACSSAQTTPTSARFDATDRSMLPLTITSVIANAIRPVSMYSEVESKRL